MSQKKFIVVLGLFPIMTFLVNCSLAQTKKKGDLFIGISGGMSVANFYNSTSPHKIFIMPYGSNYYGVFNNPDITKSTNYFDYKTNLFKDIVTAGTMSINAEYFVKENISIYTGISYEPKGINLTYTDSTATAGSVYKTKIKLSYLSIPVLLRKYITPNKHFFIEAGVYFGYLRSSSINHYQTKYINDGYSNEYSKFYYNWTDLSGYTNNFDYGLSTGVGYVRQVAKRFYLTGEFRVNVGLIKLDSKYNNDYDQKVSFSSNSLYYLIRSTNYFGLNSNSKILI